MKRVVAFFAICAFGIAGNGSPNTAIADDLDSRLAEVEKKNLDLKKMVRIEALEKENLALSQKLNVTTAHTGSAAVTTAKAPREPAVYNAMAADYPTKSGPRYAPPEVLAPQWAGPYLGLHAGMGFGKWPTSISSVSSSTGSPATAFNASDNSSSLGGLAGLHAGYLWQIGAFVFGPELDLDVSTVGNKRHYPNQFFPKLRRLLIFRNISNHEFRNSEVVINFKGASWHCGWRLVVFRNRWPCHGRS